jgi:hypothetical protein
MDKPAYDIDTNEVMFPPATHSTWPPSPRRRSPGGTAP